MRFAPYLVMLALCGCAASHSQKDDATATSEEFVALGIIHRFHDASALSEDRFNNLYVMEASSNSVIKLSPQGDSIRATGGIGSEHNQFNNPIDIDARMTNTVFIADYANHRIEQYTKDLTYVATISTRASTNTASRFGYPQAVATDAAGNIYIADGENKRVIKMRSDYSIERTIGSFSEATRPDAVLSNPVDLAVTSDEHLIVLDNGGASLVSYDNLGNALARVDLGASAGSICTSNDTIFALIPREKLVRRFVSSQLREVGAVRLHDPEAGAESPAPFVCFLARSGTYYLLTRRCLYSFGNLGSIIARPTLYPD